MRTTKLLALTLAGVMAASLLTGCPQQQGGPDASTSSSSSSRPHHTGGSNDDSSSDASSDSSSSSEPEIPEGGYTIDETTGTYHVYTAEGLKAWADSQNVQSTNCTLEDDITLTGEWEPISSYAGIFDGQGYTISGLQVTGTGSEANGIFGVIAGGCVKNLRLEKPVVNRTMDYGYGIPPCANNGAIAGTLRGGQIIGCTVSNATISKSTAGGIVGSTSMSGSDGTITGCAVINSQITGGTVGGIAGSVETNTTITGCCSVGSTVTGNTVDGGIVASILDKNAAYLTANACYWDGEPENGVGSNPDHQGVTKVDGATTWGTAVDAMNAALEGTPCTYRYGITGNTPTLGPDSGAKALARLFNLTWPL